MPRYRHIVCIANRQFWTEFLKIRYLALRVFAPTAGRRTDAPVFLPSANCCHFAALHQGNYATIPNYLERELRYMDAGE
jgi:hypothetical protein